MYGHFILFSLVSYLLVLSDTAIAIFANTRERERERESYVVKVVVARSCIIALAHTHVTLSFPFVLLLLPRNSFTPFAPVSEFLSSFLFVLVRNAMS